MRSTPSYIALTFRPAFIEKQTVAFNLKARENFKKTTRARMGVWQAIELLNTLVDDSDPDVCFHSACFTTRFLLTQFMLIDKRVSNRTSLADCRGYTARWQARVDAGEFICIAASAGCPFAHPYPCQCTPSS